jgi:drug/metabolite transporter (DMT)-like permease
MSFSRLSEARRGIAWMLFSVLIAAGMDATSKYLSQFYPVMQIVWARYAFQAIPLMLVLAPRLPRLMRTTRLGMQLVRSALLLGATITFITGLKKLPLTEASTILFLAPLIVTALSVPMLGERVGPRRWLAVAAGFLGAMIVIRPAGEVVNLWVAFPLATAFLYAFYMVATRQLSRTDSSLTTLVYTGLVGTLVMSAIVPFDWVAPDARGWALMVLLGIMGSLNHFALILAFRSAPAAVISPFDYSRLIWATVLGFLLFGHLPDGWTILGATVIVGAGLYVYRREAEATGDTAIGTSSDG